jgi:hypothetical protein
MPDRSMYRRQTKYNPWFSRSGVGRGADGLTPEKFTIMKPWRRPRPAQGCRASEEEEEELIA